MPAAAPIASSVAKLREKERDRSMTTKGRLRLQTTLSALLAAIGEKDDDDAGEKALR